MKRNLLERIEEGTIKTNFNMFPASINGFTREPVMVDDTATATTFNHAGYVRGNDLGCVTVADVEAGRLQVRKYDEVKPEVGRKVLVPSDRVW